MELDQFRDVDLVIDRANDSFVQKQFVSQGDYKGRSLTVQVTNNGSVGEVPGLTLNLRWHNEASGLTDLSAFSVIDASNSIFRIEYPQNMMTPGKVFASVQILQNGKTTQLKEFELTVQQLAGEAVGIAQQAEFSALVAVLADSNKFRTDIANLDNKKADLSLVNTKISELGELKFTGTYATLAILQSEKPSGDNGLYIVQENQSWYYYASGWRLGGKVQAELTERSVKQENIAVKSVTPSNLSILPAKGKIGRNLFNKDVVLWDKILDPNGLLQANLYPEIAFGVSEMIEVKPSVTYRKSQNDTAWLYNDSGLPIQAVTGAIFTTTADTAFFRSVVRKDYVESFMLYEGSTYIDYKPYEIILDTEFIESNSIGKDKLANDFVEATLGKNLFDKNTVTAGYYVLNSTGKLVVSTAGYGVSDFIKLDPGQTYYKNDNQQWAYYSEKDLNTYISGVPSGNVFTAPSNAHYVRITVPLTVLDSFQLEKGNQATTYEKYGKYIQEETLSPEIVQKINAQSIDNNFKIQLPSIIYLTANEEYQIHWYNVITKYYKLKQSGLSVRLAKVTSSGYEAIGEDTGEMWKYTPSTSGDIQVEIRITDNASQVVVESKQITLRTSALLSSAKTKTIVTIGDSFVDGYLISKYMHDFVTSDTKKTLNMIGLNDTGKVGVKDDAWSGQSYSWYYTIDRGYLRNDRPLSDAYWDTGWGKGEANGWTEGQTFADLTATQRSHGFTKNEFYDATGTKKFNFGYFMTNYMNNQNVDGVVFVLGLNDAIWDNPVSLKSKLSDYKTKLDYIYSSILAYSSVPKILINLVTPQQKNDAFMRTYGGSTNPWLTDDRAKESQEVWNQFILDTYDTSEWKAKGLYVMSTNAHFDTEHGLRTKTIKPVKFDQTITKIVTSDVHPSETGAQYIADTVRNAINGILFV
ncbi:BppU family phage baseplate upper protein [Enterococcus casseliflavus]|uniref:BppU family phage baseplate upper protein n=1 Tax=Enterococcus casseliflavus TaxID=37734 RepID=UPI001E55A47F|nr:BppU family phage baseplate upper protein [Enterococcus casseliflavus]MCD4961191.1 BppU family phage baseplate upper protein [Enterococcus casseliflavus]